MKQAASGDNQTSAPAVRSTPRGAATCKEVTDGLYQPVPTPHPKARTMSRNLLDELDTYLGDRDMWADIRDIATLDLSSQVSNLNQRASKKYGRLEIITAPEIKLMWAYQNGKCYYCTAYMGLRFDVDHVLALANGGSNALDNMVLACPACNIAKHRKDAYTFFRKHNPDAREFLGEFDGGSDGW